MTERCACVALDAPTCYLRRYGLEEAFVLGAAMPGDAGTCACACHAESERESEDEVVHDDHFRGK